ncbi:MAG: U32 family peptidase [Clostridiales bacterium]|jgi:putative protease|nr:U32 family peptidase [Clostridiales bacterium]
MIHLDKVELLAPAGDFERLQVAVAFGADAVYMGGTTFGLRAAAKNFDSRQMAEAIEYAHVRGVKVYVTANIFAHNADFDGMSDYFREVCNMGADALIISDPGIFALARQAVPDMEIHISTQANVTNYPAAQFWAHQGASRVILARELSLNEISEIYDKVKGEIALEAFVHGAVCMAYSGRCFLSAYMNDRDANKGRCANNCRFKYALVEEQRPGEYFPIGETDGRGSHILSSKDLCMIAYLPEMLNAGIVSLKIEGRMKTPHYVAAVVSAYRAAIDDYYADEEIYRAKIPQYMADLQKSANRDFSTGFYLGRPDGDSQAFYGKHSKTYDFVGIVKDYDDEKGIATVEQRNKFVIGDTVEFLRAHGEPFSQIISEMHDADGNPVDAAPHAQQMLKIRTTEPVSALDIMRVKMQ